MGTGEQAKGVGSKAIQDNARGTAQMLMAESPPWPAVFCGAGEPPRLRLGIEYLSEPSDWWNGASAGDDWAANAARTELARPDPCSCCGGCWPNPIPGEDARELLCDGGAEPEPAANPANGAFGGGRWRLSGGGGIEAALRMSSTDCRLCWLLELACACACALAFELAFACA